MTTKPETTKFAFPGYIKYSSGNNKNFCASMMVKVLGYLIIIIIQFNQNTDAQDNNTFHLDSLINNDSLIYCAGTDSVMLIPKKDADNIYWVINADKDTVRSDTLVLQNGYNGNIGFQSTGGEIHLFISPFTISDMDDKTIICGDTVMPEVSSNYREEGNLTYNWSPGSLLNDSTIKDPYALIYNDTIIKVTVLTPGGCQSADSLKVRIIPMNSPAICNVSVNEEYNIVITWEKPKSKSVHSYNIYRETDLADVYQKIGYAYNISGSSYTDTKVNPNMYSYKYKISIVDYCGLESGKSPYHKTMVLHLDYESNTILNFSWEPYEGLNASYYNFYKGISPQAMEIISAFDIDKTQCKDSLESDKSYFFYRVEAVDTNNYPVCTNQENNGISAFSNFVTNNPSHINDLYTHSDFILVYPNPAMDEFMVETVNDEELEGEVEISNSAGQIIKKINLNPDKTIIGLDNYKDGLYILKIKTNKGNITKMIVKN